MVPQLVARLSLLISLQKKHRGEIVNADSMLYRQLPILTSSPALELKNEFPYHLYNFLDVESEYCVAEYAEEAAKKIRDIANRGGLPVLVGGSGMYISDLINGYQT